MKQTSKTLAVTVLNYSEKNAEKISNAGYNYYKFTEESIREMASKPIQDLNTTQLYSLVQMLYPDKLICSGLFENVLIFKVSAKGRRIDPPVEHWMDLTSKGSDGILFVRICKVLTDAGIKIHDSWTDVIHEIELDEAAESTRNDKDCDETEGCNA